MMTSFLPMIGVETMFQTSENMYPSPTRPKVRVIWGRGLGSTYQGYSPNSPGRSRFSGPLTCPDCGGSLELSQRDESSPDHLSATCDGCGCETLMDIAGDGRITSR